MRKGATLIGYHFTNEHLINCVVKSLASNHDDENMQQLMHLDNAWSQLTKPKKLHKFISISLRALIFDGDLILSIVIKKRGSDSYMYNVLYHRFWYSIDIDMRRFNKKITRKLGEFNIRRSDWTVYLYYHILYSRPLTTISK